MHTRTETKKKNYTLRENEGVNSHIEYENAIHPQGKNRSQTTTTDFTEYRVGLGHA